MGKYIADNPQFIVSGFAKSGISRALDGGDDTESTGDEVEDTTTSTTSSDETSFETSDEVGVLRSESFVLSDHPAVTSGTSTDNPIIIN